LKERYCDENDPSRLMTSLRVKDWESSPTIPVTPVEVGGYVSAIDSNGRTTWIADAHRDDGKRFVVRADEKLTAFMELEAAVDPFSASSFL
jgi:hypothetical protein